MLMAARHFALQRDLLAFRRPKDPSPTTTTTTTTCHPPHSSSSSSSSACDEWLDTQDRVNQAVQQLQQPQSRGPSKRMIRFHVVQSVTASSTSSCLRCLGLFRAMRESPVVQSLSLVGLGPQLEQDALSAQALSQALVTCPNLVRLHMTHISLFQQQQETSVLLSSLGQALAHPSLALKELRLAFCEQQQQQQQDNDDERSRADHTTQRLLQALAHCRGLHSLQLFGLDLSSSTKTMELLVQLIRQLPSLRELRLVRCNLSHVGPLCQAIQQTNRPWTKIDFSMNHISDWHAITPLLWQSSSKHDSDTWSSFALTELSLSHNQLSGRNGHEEEHDGSHAFCQALATNTSLKRLSLDLNPLSDSMGWNLYEVLQRDNTSLLRLSIVIASAAYWTGPRQRQQQRRQGVSFRPLTHTCAERLRHVVALNEAGRGWLRQERHALPQLVARVRNEPQLVYGLLREQPPPTDATNTRTTTRTEMM